MNQQETQLNAMTLGEIAAQLPGATAVFRHYGLDFCCAGNQPFTAALEKKGIDINAVTKALKSLPQGTSDGTPGMEADDKTLVDYIIHRYHNVHREQFPELIRLTGRVEKVHAENPLCPRGLGAHLTDMFDDLSQHMEKEETILFPMLCNGDRAMAAGPIAVMESEHVGHGHALSVIQEITHNGHLPDEACNTWRALYTGLAQLEEDLMQHIHLENNILFAR